MAKAFQGVAPVATPNTSFIRQKLKETMVLGLPVADTDKPTFHFDRVTTWDENDREGNPYDWAAAPLTDGTKASALVICAYQFFSPLGRQGAFITEVGEFNPTTVVFTLFKKEFDTIFGFSSVTIGPSDQVWYFRYYRPSYSIVDLQAFQVHCQAEGNK